MNESHNEESEVRTHVAQEPDKRALFEHCVYEGSDAKLWKMPEREPGSWHPGVCWEFDEVQGVAVLYKGTSQQPKKSRYLYAYAIVEPNDDNGLEYQTFFNLNDPFDFRPRQIELMNHGRLRGELTAAEVEEFENVLDELRGKKHGS